MKFGSTNQTHSTMSPSQRGIIVMPGKNSVNKIIKIIMNTNVT